MKKYGRTGQATNDNIIRRTHNACCVTPATNIHAEYVIHIVFHSKNGYANAPRCYEVHALIVLLNINFSYRRGN